MRWVSERLTLNQQRYAYAWRTLMNADIILAGGSDAPVENCDPFRGIHDAIYRRARINEIDVLETTEAAVKVEGIETNQTQDNKKQKINNDSSSMTTNSSIALLKENNSNNNNIVEMKYPYLESEADTYRKEECLSFSEALNIYTIGAAFAGYAEHYMGRIQVDYVGDFIVIDAPPINDTNLQNEGLDRYLCTVKPNMMVIGGKVLYYNKNKINKLQTNAYTKKTQPITENDFKITQTQCLADSSSTKKDSPAELRTTSISAISHKHMDTDDHNTKLQQKPLTRAEQQVTMKGPFIPGKNGRFRCACIFLGQAHLCYQI